MAVHPVTITTPDQVSRVLRLTFGAQKRISDRVGNPEIPEVAKDLANASDLYTINYIASNLVDLAYCLVYNEDGTPPSDLTLEKMREMYPPDDPELFGAVVEAMSRGKKKQQEMSKALQGLEDALIKTIGSRSGASPESTSTSKVLRRRRKSSRASSGT